MRLVSKAAKKKSAKKRAVESEQPKSRQPKKKCCVSKDRCKRCPIRMLKEGTLPPGYTVKKRRVVRVDEAA